MCTDSYLFGFVCQNLVLTVINCSFDNIVLLKGYESSEPFFQLKLSFGSINITNVTLENTFGFSLLSFNARECGTNIQNIYIRNYTSAFPAVTIQSITSGSYFVFMHGCSFVQCSSQLQNNSGTGALSVSETSDFRLYNSFFINCTSPNNGGGICMKNVEALLFNNLIFNTCSAKDGGAIFLTMPKVFFPRMNKLSISSTTFTNCSATVYGDNLFMSGFDFPTLLRGHALAVTVDLQRPNQYYGTDEATGISISLTSFIYCDDAFSLGGECPKECVYYPNTTPSTTSSSSFVSLSLSSSPLSSSFTSPFASSFSSYFSPPSSSSFSFFSSITPYPTLPFYLLTFPICTGGVCFRDPKVPHSSCAAGCFLLEQSCVENCTEGYKANFNTYECDKDDPLDPNTTNETNDSGNNNNNGSNNNTPGGDEGGKKNSSNNSWAWWDRNMWFVVIGASSGMFLLVCVLVVALVARYIVKRKRKKIRRMNNPININKGEGSSSEDGSGEGGGSGGTKEAISILTKLRSRLSILDENEI